MPVQDHLGGKQYLGWLAIREKHKELQEAAVNAPAPANGVIDLPRQPSDAHRCVCRAHVCRSAVRMATLQHATSSCVCDSADNACSCFDTVCEVLKAQVQAAEGYCAGSAPEKTETGTATRPTVTRHTETAAGTETGAQAQLQLCGDQLSAALPLTSSAMLGLSQASTADRVAAAIWHHVMAQARCIACHCLTPDWQCPM